LVIHASVSADSSLIASGIMAKIDADGKTIGEKRSA
jgi:hypothetical protein